jgi:hypothetical protein
VAGILGRYVPGDRVQVTALCEPPRTIVEWHDRRSILELRGNELRSVRWIIAGMSALFVPVILFEFYRDWRSGLTLTVLCTVMCGLFWAVMQYIERDHRANVADLNARIPER